MSDHTLDRHLQAMREWAENLQLAKGAILVGQDWGGPLVVAMGMACPEVSGVVLANTSILVPKRPLGTSFHKFARTPVVSDIAFRLAGFPLNILGRVQGDPKSISGHVARAYRWPLPLGRRAGPLGLARMVPSSPDHPSVAALREMEAWTRAFDGPMALVWGERDPILGRALKRHVETFPQATVTRTQAGHFLQEEVPDELARRHRGCGGQRYLARVEPRRTWSPGATKTAGTLTTTNTRRAERRRWGRPRGTARACS